MRRRFYNPLFEPYSFLVRNFDEILCTCCIVAKNPDGFVKPVGRKRCSPQLRKKCVQY